MSDSTTHPIDTEAFRRLADAATPGPWEAGPVEWHDFDETQIAQSSVRTAERVAITWDDHGGDVFAPEDAEFIAAARTAVPALLDENEALRKQVEDGRTHRRYLIGKLKGTNHRADNHKARAEQAEARESEAMTGWAEAQKGWRDAEARIKTWKCPKCGCEQVE